MPLLKRLAGIPEISSVASDLIDFRYDTRSVTCTFAIPGDPTHAVKAHFRGQCIVRLLDEMPLSTEMDDSPNAYAITNGAHSWVYEVEGAQFFRIQSALYKINFPTAKHYRLVTGCTCLDVISPFAPEFSVVGLSTPERMLLLEIDLPIP